MMWAIITERKETQRRLEIRKGREEVAKRVRSWKMDTEESVEQMDEQDEEQAGSLWERITTIKLRKRRNRFNSEPTNHPPPPAEP